MIDLVLNHTSTEHPWFKKALAGDPFYRDFYYFRPAKADGSPPTNWVSKFGGNAWENCLTPLSTICIYTMLRKLI